ncbi:dephospho-CoA kinase [uncultured Roseovarius sp.]|uniref:dephospho-CoA kinase n=1 Tax=uncultured Roseovarius sp. TaxID=293344 RepID=UPI002604A2E6|nr:dephospho-CoA kinase [uncultured Roseovarius sp.]
MSFLIGLTGSIGMGKSTTARMFAEEGCALWDADAAVHRLYAKGGAAVKPVSALYPAAIENDAVSRFQLKQIIAQDPKALSRIENLVHPLVAQDRAKFIRDERVKGTDIIVLDVPLLFETGTDLEMDATVTVSVPFEVQRARVLERGTMTQEQLDNILKKQMSDREKRARADYVITTDSLDHARDQVQDVLAKIRGRMRHA